MVNRPWKSRWFALRQLVNWLSLIPAMSWCGIAFSPVFQAQALPITAANDGTGTHVTTVGNQFDISGA